MMIALLRPPARPSATRRQSEVSEDRGAGQRAESLFGRYFRRYFEINLQSYPPPSGESATRGAPLATASRLADWGIEAGRRAHILELVLWCNILQPSSPPCTVASLATEAITMDPGETEGGGPPHKWNKLSWSLTYPLHI